MSENFAQLGVSPKLTEALARDGFITPFPIQISTLPDAIGGRDVLGRGRTGSGKTLAFSLALLTRLTGRKARKGQPLAVILAPTRELAMQIDRVVSPLARGVGLSSVVIAGGMPFGKQLQALERGVTILVATPGRLIDLMNRGAADLSKVEIVVLDEADQMADMGFMPSMHEILNATPERGQRLLFSATLDRDVDALVRRYLKDPVVHEVDPGDEVQGVMDHHVFVVKSEDRDRVLARIGAREGRTIMFVRTQHGADRLATKLAKQGVAASSLHGGKAQGARTRALEAFRSGTTPVLVATNVAARGIHVDDISLVVHVDAPTDPKDYLHRAGRTARAGESGTVVTLAHPNQRRQMRSLGKHAGIEFDIIEPQFAIKGLEEVTGAREPSGIAWQPPVERTHVPRRRSGGHRRQAHTARGKRGRRPARKG
jgi:superfamily II DNA/RNA helicase